MSAGPALGRTARKDGHSGRSGRHLSGSGFDSRALHRPRSLDEFATNLSSRLSWDQFSFLEGGVVYELRIGDQVFETRAVLDTALARAKSVSRAFCGICICVVFVQGSTRVVRAFADNGAIVWAKACAKCKAKGCYDCTLGFVRERI